MVVDAVAAGNHQVEEDARRIGQYKAEEHVDDAQQLASRVFTTIYLGTVNSSEETRSRYALPLNVFWLPEALSHYISCSLQFVVSMLSICGHNLLDCMTQP